MTENATQAIARDVLAEGMLRADEWGFDIRGHVHDEIVSLVDECSLMDHTDLEWLMSEPVDWAPDLPLGAAGYTGEYYHK